MAHDLEISLISSRLYSLKFEVKPGVSPKGKISVDLAITNKYKYDYNNKSIVVLISVDVVDGGLPFTLKLEYEGFFKLNKRVPKKEIEPIAKINCSAILFPFAREAVAEITRRSGFHPLLLPVINFAKSAEGDKTKYAMKSDENPPPQPATEK